jgi:serine/threonine-protein kinase
MGAADPMQPVLAVGTEIAGYRVESFISRGGMAVIYRAHDRRLGRRVALKLLAPELSQDERFQQRFLRESRLAASLDHPNIIPIYEAGEASGLLYIVMRYVEGSDMKELIDREGPLELDQITSILRQVGAALDAAHARGLVHRDVKPGNILIASGTGREDPDHVYLTDFGLTKRSSSLSGQTTTGRFIGTMDYVAPEQIGGKPVDARTDVYSLGCVLYHGLTGEPPFDRDDEAALLWAHLVDQPPPVSTRRPDLPPGLDAVVAKAMTKAPEDRYGSCRDLIVDFRDEVEGRAGSREQRPSATATASADRPARSAAPPRRPPPAGPSARRSRRVPALVAAVLLLALVAGGFLYLRGRGDELANSFARNELVPFSFRYPEGWQQAEQGNQEVFSPRARELLSFFIALDGSGWSQVGALTDRAPSETVGLYTFFNGTRMDGQTAEEIQAYLKPFLPREASFSPAHDRLVVGGYAADRLEGALREPGGQSAVLRFQCYVVHAVPDGRSVYLVFFSSADTFEGRRALFERITKSVDFLT